MPGSRVETYTVSCAAGLGLAALRSAIVAGRSGLRPTPRPDAPEGRWLGGVPVDLDAVDWPARLAAWDSRNNRLAWLGLQQDGFEAQARAVIARVGADRVGLLVGTSTSSIGRTEQAYRELLPDGRFAPAFIQPGVHNPHSTGAFLAQLLGIHGPIMSVGTACSSSAKVFASAERWLEAGLVDAVIIAGVDSLCRSTISGFESLQLLSRSLCRPFDVARDGLNIGEAAAFALLRPATWGSAPACLAGYGETCDAYHMSSPHPEGLGARLAIEQALQRAGLQPRDIGYVNLHGTGTRINDAVESMALQAALPQDVPASSTKGLTGHTLGAAGMVEAVIAMDTLLTGVLPASFNLQQRGEDIVCAVLLENLHRRVDFVLSNSFGFGGNNCTLVFGRVA
ncbi:MAG: beta-ketoacyl-ACP synthase [Gammaproteobacteria bacterium]|nr:beta-ketoacyl-ACP synthase [Gammaproteobacteria bacterium]